MSLIVFTVNKGLFLLLFFLFYYENFAEPTLIKKKKMALKWGCLLP